jgi:hypothetical protein
MPATVRLTPSELRFAADVGVARQIQNMIKGRRDRDGAECDDPNTIHIGGARAECAVAKYFGRYWIAAGALGDFTACDVDGIQVRWTRATHAPHLRIRKTDADDAPFVLVTGDACVYTLHGWMFGRDAKDPTYWGDRGYVGRPCQYFVPVSDLSAVDALADWLAEYDYTRRHARIACE